MSKSVTYIKTTSLTNKFSQLVIALVLSIVIFNIWLNLFFTGNKLVEDNSQLLAENILQQTTYSAAFYLDNGELDSLKNLTNSALQSKHVLEMLIYNDKGIVVAKSDNAINAKERFFSADDSIKNAAPAPFVKEIRNHNNELLGFVRLTILKSNLQKGSRDFLTNVIKQFVLIAFLAGTVGYLLTTGLKPFSKNAFIAKS